ncbi:MAG: hypothetical protein AB7L76_04910 [Burkholderiaceae bacterium]
MNIKGIIFDFDGAIADSETLANAILAESVTELGAASAAHVAGSWDEMTAQLGRL